MNDIRAPQIVIHYNILFAEDRDLTGSGSKTHDEMVKMLGRVDSFHHFQNRKASNGNLTSYGL